MENTTQCEYCDRPIKNKPTRKILRGKSHIFCSEFCYLLSFYDVPKISYDDLKKMYSLRCISVLDPAESDESRTVTLKRE